MAVTLLVVTQAIAAVRLDKNLAMTADALHAKLASASQWLAMHSASHANLACSLQLKVQRVAYCALLAIFNFFLVRAHAAAVLHS